MKYFFTILMYCLAYFTFAQNTFKFNNRLKPNSTYLMTVNTITDMKYDIEGLEENNQVIKTSSELDLKTKTFNQDNNGNIPYELTYTRIKTNTSLNGTNFPSENLDYLYKVKFRGIDKPTGRELTEFEGLEQNKKLFEVLFNSFKNLTVYPTQTFAIGDTYSITNVLDFPMPDGSNFSFNYKMDYTLNKIENGKAFFSVKMSASNESKEMNMLTMTIKSYDVNGNVWVDVNDNNVTGMELNGPFVLELKGERIKIKTTTNSHYVIKSYKL